MHDENSGFSVAARGRHAVWARPDFLCAVGLPELAASCSFQARHFPFLVAAVTAVAPPMLPTAEDTQSL
jgi:hypothetical protein